MNTLYISYDGMTDPLGQSQVLPYLIYLSKKGYKITILSAEKTKNFENNKQFIYNQIKDTGIDWQYIKYTASPPVISTLWDIYKLKKNALKLHRQKKFKIIHCRSYISALIGLHFKKKMNIPFIFDMRGFWADERVDGKIWNLKNPVFNAVYKYFKRKEKEFINRADHIITLTKQGKNILNSWQTNINPTPVSVIPCCVDTQLFSYDNINADKVEAYRKTLNIKEGTKIISYLGSLGTWYMADEMMDFYKSLSAQKPEYKFMFISYDNPEDILKLADKYSIDHQRIIVVKARRDEVPVLLSLSSISIFFIKPVFSKKASSPTKQAEVLSMGIPIICNDGIGDTSEIITSNKVGIIIKNFNLEDYLNAINQIDNIIETPKNNIRKVALDLFSLDTGGEKYTTIYNSFKNEQNE